MDFPQFPLVRHPLKRLTRELAQLALVRYPLAVLILG